MSKKEFVGEGGIMKNDLVDYGMEIVISSNNITTLFVDRLDMERYILSLAKMVNKESNSDIKLLIAGFGQNILVIVFKGGNEEKLKKIIQKTHISYSSYRRNKKSPVSFDKTKFNLLEGKRAISIAVKNVKNESEYICTDIFVYNNIFIKAKKSMVPVEKYLYATELAREFNEMDLEEKRNFIVNLRVKYSLSYRNIGKILNYSSSKIYRIVNK